MCSVQYSVVYYSDVTLKNVSRDMFVQMTGPVFVQAPGRVGIYKYAKIMLWIRGCSQIMSAKNGGVQTPLPLCKPMSNFHEWPKDTKQMQYLDKNTKIKQDDFDKKNSLSYTKSV